MPTCKEITELATEYAEGSLDPALRRAFEAHVAACSGCQAWVAQLQASVRAVAGLPAPRLSPALSEALMRRFDAWDAARVPSAAEPARATARANRERRVLLVLPALGAAAVAMIALARQPSPSPVDWAVALGLGGVAVALIARLRRLTSGFAIAAGAVTVVAALLRGREGSLSVLGGAECAATEAALACGAVVLAWLVARRRPEALLRSSLGAWAVTGALAGDAALQITCAEHGSLPHLLVFHAGGVLVLAVVAWAWARRELQVA